LAVGAAVGGAEEEFAAVGAAAGKDQATVGADLGAGEELHLAAGAGEGEFQVAVRTTLDGFGHGRAAAGAEGLSAGGAGRVADVDAGAALGTDQIAGLFWFPFGVFEF
jgi:hypothetical protein